MKLALLVASGLAGVALVAAYLGLGGASYRPTAVADPCAPRVARPASGTDEEVQRVVLAAADETACALGVSREELVLSLRSVDELEELARREGVSRDELEDSLRMGLERAVTTAEDEGLVGDRTAGVLRFAASRLPLSLLLTVLRGATGLIGV